MLAAVSVIGESPVSTPAPDGVLNIVSLSPQMDLNLDLVKCDCCGLSEECTLSYIEAIRKRYGGKWICGLCAEAVKDESSRCQKLISPDEAMARHLSFCNKFRASGPPQDPGLHLIQALSQVLRKRLDSPRSSRSAPNSPRKHELKKTESCIPCLCLVGIEELGKS